jgi:hypothetical protein
VAELYEKIMVDFSDDDLRTMIAYVTRNNEISPEVIERVKRLD